MYNQDNQNIVLDGSILDLSDFSLSYNSFAPGQSRKLQIVWFPAGQYLV